MLLNKVENVKYGLENPEGDGRSFSLPPDQIMIPLPLGFLLQSILYPIVCSSGIILYRLKGRQWCQVIGRGGHWYQSIGTCRLRRRKRTEGGIWVDAWLGGRWDVTLYFFFIVSFGCAITSSTAEGQKLKYIYNGLLKV